MLGHALQVGGGQSVDCAEQSLHMRQCGLGAKVRDPGADQADALSGVGHVDRDDIADQRDPIAGHRVAVGPQVDR